jgi:hypothetical protein
MSSLGSWKVRVSLESGELLPLGRTVDTGGRSGDKSLHYWKTPMATVVDLLIDDVAECFLSARVRIGADGQRLCLRCHRSLEPVQLGHSQTTIDHSLSLVAIGVADLDVKPHTILKVAVDQIAQDEVEHIECLIVGDAAFSYTKRDLSFVVWRQYRQCD